MEHWQSTIDQVTQGFWEIAEDLSAEELHLHPQQDAWSIAQIMDHLRVINGTYFPILEALKAGTYQNKWTARFPFLVRFFGNMILRSVQPESPRKVRTFPVWEPSQEPMIPNVRVAFSHHQERLKEAITQASPLLKTDPVIGSPANPWIVYRLSTAFDIIVAHECRHLAQAQFWHQQLRAKRPHA